MKTEFRYDIAILRLLCIVVVVYFHAYGMTYAEHFSNSTAELYRIYYEYFNKTYLINIAMPMFIFISGFLFGGQLLSRNYSFIRVLKNKFMRIMLPFFLFTILFMFTTNSISWKPFYEWTYWHLWFLPMIFWCFIIGYLIRPLLYYNFFLSVIILIISFSISLFQISGSTFLALGSIVQWFCWFALGMFIYKYETIILQSLSSIKKGVIIILLITVYFFIILNYPWEYGERTILGQFATISITLALWLLFNWIPWKNFLFTDVLVALSGYSFGIYIFHNWLEMHMLSRTAQRLLPIEQLAIDNPWVFPFAFGTLAFLLSLGCSWVFMKTKIGKRLIG